MKRTYTWKGLWILIGACLIIALVCQLTGNSGMASAFVVMSAAEILIGVIVIMTRKAVSKIRRVGNKVVTN